MVGVGDAKEDVPVKGTSLQPNAVARRDSMAAKVGCLATARMLGRLASADRRGRERPLALAPPHLRRLPVDVRVGLAFQVQVMLAGGEQNR